MSLKKSAPLALVALALLAPRLRAETEKMAPDLQRWLEDVTPILTRTEKVVFRKLETNADRAKFVRFF